VPAQIADAIRASFSRALDDEVFRASLTKVGFPPQRSRGQVEIDQFVAADRARWAAVIKALNISLD
jgi:tripartite-type tricarboxylate transporter receptor subunit TctC